MNDLIIPGWAVYLIAGLIIWMVWLTVMYFKNAEAIAVNTAEDKNVRGELIKISDSISEMKEETKGSFNRLENRMDTLFGSEMAFLKNLATNNFKGAQ